MIAGTGTAVLSAAQPSGKIIQDTFKKSFNPAKKSNILWKTGIYDVL